jgi:hypothetical protein
MKRSLFLAFFSLAACSSSSSTPTPDTPAAPDAGAPPAAGDAGPSAPSAAAAQQALWDAMHAADPKAGEAAIAQLQAVYAANPKNPHNTLLLGAGSMWLVAESGRDPASAGAIGQKYGPMAGQYLQEAHGMNPTYGFITSFVGFLLFDQGSNTSNDGMVTQGKQLIDQGLSQSPLSGWFFELLEAERVPPNDPQVQKALDGAWTYYDTCAGQPIDRTHPDFSAYFAKGPGTQFCASDDISPFATQGLMFHFGDLLVKQGKVDLAKTVYESVQASPGFDKWPHKDTLNARLGSDLAARAAAYNGDPKTWPALGEPPYSCTICHGVTGK